LLAYLAQTTMLKGQILDVFWDYELDRLILEEEGWADLATKGFDPPRHFAAG